MVRNELYLFKYTSMLLAGGFCLTKCECVLTINGVGTAYQSL